MTSCLFGVGCLALLGCVVGVPEPAQAACRVERRAEVPIHFAAHRALVDVAVDGHTATFLLDTGADRTVFSAAAVRDMGLSRDPWVSTSIRGVGGVTERTANVMLQSFTQGGVALRRRSVAPTLSFAVARLDLGQPGGAPVAGLLGADYLSVFDLDLDLPAGKLILDSTDGCAGAPIPWNVAVPLGRPTPTALLAPVRTGGSTLQAQLDTGASLSLIGIKGAARLGITPDLLARDAPGSARGIGRLTLALRNHIVPSLRLGSVEFRDVPLAFRTPAGGLPFDMLLGADLLGQQRVFISYATDRLLIAVPP